MKNLKWLRSVAFILLLTISVAGIMHCYGLPKTYNTKNIAAFDAEKKNQVDGVVMGTSVVAQCWLTPVAWQEYGLSIYHLATGAQCFGITTEYLSYAKETQDIKYAVIDVHGLRTDAIKSGLTPPRFQSAYLDMPDFETSLKARKAIFDFAEQAYEFYNIDPVAEELVDIESSDYNIPLYNFHSRWVDGLGKSDFVTVKNEYMGADDRTELAFGVTDCSEYIDVLDFKGTYKPDSFQKAQLQKLFDFAEENDIELLFINLPTFRSTEAQQQLNGIIKYCSDKGYKTIDFATKKMLKEVGIDLKTDYANRGHLNSKGGEKTTKYVCEYLIENGFEAVDHRGDKEYSHWDSVAKDYAKFYNDGWTKNK